MARLFLLFHLFSVHFEATSLFLSSLQQINFQKKELQEEAICAIEFSMRARYSGCNFVLIEWIRRWELCAWHLFIGGYAAGIAPELWSDRVFIFRCLFLPFVVKAPPLDGFDSFLLPFFCNKYWLPAVVAIEKVRKARTPLPPSLSLPPSPCLC